MTTPEPTYSRPFGARRRTSNTCPTGRCDHPLALHDVDEIDWPCIERCQAPECRCAGLVAPVGTP